MSSKVEHYYEVYGLKIKSDIELPELIKSDGLDYEINICVGNTPNDVLKSIEQGRNLYLDYKKIWFNIKSVGTYLIYNGNTIVVDRCANSEAEDVKAYLLGSALGLMLFQRNTLAIHGGTVVINNKTLTLVGDSGSGKSTLTTALRLHKHLFMADDVSVVNDNLMVNSSYPQQKLCKDTMLKLGYKLSEFKKIDDDREKYKVPVVRENFVSEPIKMGAICEIRVGNNSKIEIEEIRGKEKLITLINNIYRIELIKKRGIRPEYFKKCLKIAQNIKFYRMYRPQNKYTIDEQIKVLENALINS
ncbi:hypothetical protein [Clostridium beijerinckii]|uniref:hypothetical protein n=1 Tax=Clostridium beijerinckii TaxID=1520 RepID=UPI00098BEE2E|nr:hypothetical protein [Clostridium beijerinckii]MBA8936685.1 GTPase SAR1 family protein [Clostridium beijerinckii]NRU40847.1 GTPase SAR1 family protein [Clostridium beijerinckii]NSA95878.1 GTPase SAR1 family protein [Clostridium beijerinckii]OOM62433.1 hypothetical protein CLOBI_22320 [Clostridium beijerinckii]OOM69449.1 hypothetical protein CLBEIC_26460 [Clostridium beijerinckii]